MAEASFATPITLVALMPAPTAPVRKRTARLMAQSAWCSGCLVAGFVAQVIHNAWWSGG